MRSCCRFVLFYLMTAMIVIHPIWADECFNRCDRQKSVYPWLGGSTPSMEGRWWDPADDDFDPYTGWDAVWGNIERIRFHPNDQWVLTGGEDGTVRIWDVATGNLVRVILKLTSYVSDIVISRDGTMMAITDKTSKILILDFNTGQLIRELSGSSGRVYGLDFSSDGTMLVSGGNDRKLRIWDIGTGQVLNTLTGHNGIVYGVKFYPDETRIVSGSTDSTVMIWDRMTGLAIDTLKGHTDDVFNLDISPDGNIIASVSFDHNAKLWDASNGTELRTLSGHTGILYSLDFSPDGSKLATGGVDSYIKIWNVNTGTLIKSFKAHDGYVYSLEFSPNGSRLASGSSDYTAKLWNMSDYSQIREWNASTDYILGIAVTPDGSRVAGGGNDRIPRIWTVPDGNLVKELPVGYPSSINCLSFSPDAQQLAVAYFKEIWFYNPETGTKIDNITAHNSHANSLVYSPDGSMLISGGDDSTVKVWDVTTRTLIRTLVGHQDKVTTVAISRDGKTIASGDDKNKIIVWNTATGEQHYVIEGHTGDVNGVTFSPDGSLLASVSDDNTVRIWNAISGSPLFSFNQGDYCYGVAFSLDGSKLAAGSENGVMSIIDVYLGCKIKSLTYDHGYPRSLVFTPDGSRLIAGGWGYHNLRVYDVSQLPPSLIISDITDIQSSQAVIRAIGIANGSATSLCIEYGTSAAYGSTLSTSPTSINGENQTWITATLSGLSPNTLYHVCLRGENTGGTNHSEDKTFTTLPGTGIDDPEPDKPKPELSLLGNYPNPFNSSTRIVYQLGHPTRVEIQVYDLAGRLIRTLESCPRMNPGRHEILWDGTDRSGHPIPSGFYCYRIQTDHQSQTRNVLVLK